MKRSFAIGRAPELIYGSDSRSQLPKLASKLGTRALVLTGQRSLDLEGRRAEILDGLTSVRPVVDFRVFGEPGVGAIDEMAQAGREAGVDLVVAVGGGSVLDAGKAVAAMIVFPAVSKTILGGWDARHPGHCLPMIALPTTAGTGSEATRNAVVTERGEGAFKKSLRHEAFVPRVAILIQSLDKDCRLS